jgi:TldD protein
MTSIKRRDFVKQCGIGLGAAITSHYWASSLFGASPSHAFKPGEVNTFGLSKEDLNSILQTAMSKGGDFAELYFEYTLSNSVVMSEDIIKNSSESVSLGVGVRVIKGVQTGYGYTNELTVEKIKETALIAAAIATGSSKAKIADLKEYKPKIQTYVMDNLVSDKDLQTKIALIREAYDAAIKHDPKIIKVSSSLADSVQYVTIANSEGLLISDVRPQVRLVVNATAEKNGVRGTGNGNDGGRIGFDFYKSVRSPKSIGEEAANEALELLEADFAPAGEYPVVLSRHQSGVMIHEAVGHPLEGDANWKKQSIMADKMGQMVASPLITIYDDSTIPHYRGSLNIDDEGVFAENAPLIEKGKLVGYLHDKLSAKIMNVKPNGHGRRESYESMPIPRMNNTVLAKGDHAPEEIISSVKKGFYAKSYQGGMVDNTGKFTFSVNLGYLIEDGKITKPLKNATLIGSNLQILKDVDMVGNDMGFFLGTCGKDGQSVPVTAGTPSIRIKKMTVGGV